MLLLKEMVRIIYHIKLHASTEQFVKAYPRANEFFELKRKVDPDYRFRNKLWKQHYEANNKQLGGSVDE